MTDWADWHEAYRDPDSPLSGRLAVVQRLIAEALDRTCGDVQVISVCAGAGKDLLGVLAGRDDGRGCTRCWWRPSHGSSSGPRPRARAAGATHVAAVVGDAALTDAYADVAPADLVLVCGVFGNIADEDVERTIGALPQLCREGGNRHLDAPPRASRPDARGAQVVRRRRLRRSWHSSRPAPASTPSGCTARPARPSRCSRACASSRSSGSP